MSRIKKLMKYALLAIIVSFTAAPFFQTTAEAEIKTTTVTMHTTDGNASNSPVLPGVGFSVFDVTEKYQQLIKQGAVAEVAKSSLIQTAEVNKAEGTLAATFGQPLTGSPFTTGQDGKVAITLNNTNDAGNNKTYLIVQTVHPTGKTYEVNSAVVTLPEKDERDEEKVSIDINPKTKEYRRDPYFYKYAKDSSDKVTGPLAGAQFRVYKVENNEKLYLLKAMTSGQNLWSKEVNDDTYITTSLADGKVTTETHRLTAGEYFFEEVSAPKGYEITEDSKLVRIVIPADPTKRVEVYVGKVNSNMNDSRVYNLLKATPPTDTSSSSSSSSSSGGTLPPTSGPGKDLPSTGEQVAKYAGISGAILILGVAGVWIYRKRHNKEN